MYLSYWGLARKPFENTPDASFFFASPIHTRALDRVLYAITEQKGCVLLTGEYGCGKTALVRKVIESLGSEQYDVALMNFPLFTCEEFMREVLFQFGVDEKAEGSQLDLFHRAGALLFNRVREGKKNLLVIDEAQIISDAGIYEQLRLLLNLQMEDRFLVDILLVGQPELQDRIREHPHMDSRIGLRFHLGQFVEDQTEAYIRHRLRIAGAVRELFTSAACSTVHEVTGGTPRRINTVCDLSLFEGATGGAAEVGEDLVRRVTA